MKYCEKCGNQLLDEAVMCPKCGCAVAGKQPTKEQNEKAKKPSQRCHIHYCWRCNNRYLHSACFNATAVILKIGAGRVSRSFSYLLHTAASEITVTAAVSGIQEVR